MTLRKIYKHWNGALELIASLQKENEELHKEINQRIKLKLENEKNADDLYNKIKILQKELDKKDKVIDELIMLLLEFDIDEIYCAKIKDCFEVADGKCSDCIKQYFYKKAEGKDE